MIVILGLSREARKVLKKYSSTGSTAVQITPMVPGFQGVGEVKDVIQSKKYFKDSRDLWDRLLDGVTHHEFTLGALGGLIDYLSGLMLNDVLCNGDVLPYQVYRGCLRMDGQTLVNLEVFYNNADGGSAGTLFKYLDNCISPSGKRLLRSWICHPLKDVEEINNRLNVVEALTMRSEIKLVVAQYLRKIPDIERLLGKVKAMVHSKAIMLLPLIGKKTLKQRNTVVAIPGGLGMQAVALRVSAERAVFYKVNILGAQDTLLDETGSHYFYHCRIQGSVDFIFGNARSLYQNSVLHSIANRSGAIAAHHRNSPEENTGFSFLNCTINGSGMIYLGRAWGPYSFNWHPRKSILV